MVNNLTTGTGKTVVLGTMGGEALSALFDLRWMLVLIVVLMHAQQLSPASFIAFLTVPNIFTIVST